VKVLQDVLDLDDEKFEKEYQNLASLHHKNVVRLVSYCNETKGEYVQFNGKLVVAEKIWRVLCFEYMCKGSLDKFIFGMIHGALLVGGS
jgi:interleukin-1 receptor-associated kinase 1/coatomer subunit beta'